MNPDYRYLGEESRHHRWNMPGSPVIETFANGKPLTLTIAPSRLQQLRLSGRRTIPSGEKLCMVFEIPDRLVSSWSDQEISDLIALSQVLPLHLIGDRIKKSPKEIHGKASDLGLSLNPITTGWTIRQLSYLLNVTVPAIAKWVESGALVSLPDRSKQLRHHVSRRALIAFIDARRFRNATLMKVDPKVLDWLVGLGQ